MELYKAMIDYITLTTTSPEDGVAMFLLNALEGAEKPAAMMQYQGMRSDSSFAGSWNDNGVNRYIFTVSGERAHWNTLKAAKHIKNASCTRIDIQYTIIRPEWYSARDLAEYLRTNKWPGRRRKVREIINDDGLDTVYVGSRTSQCYERIYVKPLYNTASNVIEHGLRYEIELKGKSKQAGMVYALIEQTPNDINEIAAGIVSQHIKRLPHHRIITHIADYVSGARDVELPVRHRYTDDYKTLLWLLNKVAPAVRRLLNNHELGCITREIISSWLDNGDEHDNGAKVE